MMMLLIFLLLLSSYENVPLNQCDLSSEFGDKITKSDLIIVGRVLNLANNDVIVSVIKILKGFQLINEVKKISNNNDFHLILVKNMKYTKDCQIKVNPGDDFIFYLQKTMEANFFDLKFALEFGDGSFEKRINNFMNGGSSSLQQNNDPCSKLNCKFGSQCQKWPGNPPTAVCHCTTTQCKSISIENRICGSDGTFYESECHMKLKECTLQKSITPSSNYICDNSLTAQHIEKTEEQQDRMSQSNSQFCQNQNCPSYASCISHPYPHCKCPTEKCTSHSPIICGTDEITYTNICELKIVSCKANRFIGQQYEGRCDLCKLYKCEFNGICEMTEDGSGTRCKCPDSNLVCPTSNQMAVCGSDDVTYESECHLRIASCRKKVSISVVHKEPCKTNVQKDTCQHKKCLFFSICRMNRFGVPQCICPTDCVYVRRPVCGSDDQTYENDCFLKVKSCAKNKTISVISEGPCKNCPNSCPFGQMCRNGVCVCADRCPKPIMQVCGSDGIYYESECELKRQACIQKKTIRTDISEASCRSRIYFSDGTDKHYAYSQQCYCDKHGSTNYECDISGVQCKCKFGVTGQYCDRCSEGYWNLTKSGCIACSCNKFGSESIQCNKGTGNCLCKQLVLGKYCSVCPSGYTMSNNGCKETFYNENKIDAVELGFMKDAFAKSYWSGSSESYLSINISFVPYSPDGIIFYQHEPNLSSDFLTIILKDRFVEFRMELGSGMLLLKSGVQLIMGRSHSILAERYNRHARLNVDETDFQYGVSPPFLTSLDSGIVFVIGQPPWLKTNIISHTNHVTDSFTGCLSSLKIIAGDETNHYLMNQQTSWMTESSNVKPNCPHIDFKHKDNIIEEPDAEESLESETSLSKDYCELHKPCLNFGICKVLPDGTYNCQCLPGYQGYRCEEMVSPIWKFKNNSFIILSTEWLQLKQRLKLEISFLPTSGNGILSFISDGHDKNPAFISVILNQNHIEVTCRTPIGVTNLRSVEPIKISKWNHVVVLKAAKYVYLNINQSQNPIKKRLIPTGFTNVDFHVRRKLTQFRITNQPIYIGGVDSKIYSRFSNVVSLKPNFQGAIQKILINREDIRFQNSDLTFQNITQWQGSPCGPLHHQCSKTDSEVSYCVAEMDKARCSCNPKQEHLCMLNTMQHDNPSNTNFNRKFNGKSAVKYTASKQKREKSTKKNNIRIKFKTNSNDGMIVLLKKIYNAKRNFLIISLRNSVIELAINLGGKNGTIRINSKKFLSDNKWHWVQVIRNNRNIVLLVDDRMFRAEMIRDSIYDTLETDGWMWLGGAKKRMEGFPWEYNTNFNGCIAELYVDEVAYNLVGDARKNIGPVLRC